MEKLKFRTVEELLQLTKTKRKNWNSTTSQFLFIICLNL